MQIMKTIALGYLAMIVLALSIEKASGEGSPTNALSREPLTTVEREWRTLVRDNPQLGRARVRFIRESETASPEGERRIAREISALLPDIEHRITFYYKRDGDFLFAMANRLDAKDSDPKYTNTIALVEAEVEAEMIKEGSHRRIGSIHRFWELKRSKLKDKGITWRSPADLNPSTSYD
jgi:hypothetical protein